MPLSVAILIGLFAMQSRGTAKVAALFGPIILLWFAVLAVQSASICIVEEPRVLAAFNPVYGSDVPLPQRPNRVDRAGPCISRRNRRRSALR